MSGNRRTCRAKVVDYSKLSATGQDDFEDDDFSSFTPPASKKPRKESKLKKRDKAKPEPVEEKENNSTIRKMTERKPLEETAYEKQLELALEMSMHGDSCIQQNSQAKVDQTEKANTDTSSCTADIEVFPKDSKCDSSATEQTRTTTFSAKSANSESLSARPPADSRKSVKRKSDVDDLDKIEVLETGIEEDDVKGRRRRRSATNVKKYTDADDDSDFDGSSNTDDKDFKISASTPEDSESDFSASDSDYEEVTRKTKTPKAKSKPAATVRGRAKADASSVPAKTNTTLSATPVQASRGSNLKKGTVTKSPSVASAVTISTCRTPLMSRPLGTSLKKQAWTPPGATGERKSPGAGCALNMGSPSGGIRLGLSKRAHVKSLHPSVQVVTQ